MSRLIYLAIVGNSCFFAIPESNIEKVRNANKRPVFGTKDAVKVQEISLRVHPHNKGRTERGQSTEFTAYKSNGQNFIIGFLFMPSRKTNIPFSLVKPMDCTTGMIKQKSLRKVADVTDVSTAKYRHITK